MCMGGGGGRENGSSDVGSFLEIAPFSFLYIQNNFINFKSLVYINLFFAGTAVTCKALHKDFLNDTDIAKIKDLSKNQLKGLLNPNFRPFSFELNKK